MTHVLQELSGHRALKKGVSTGQGVRAVCGWCTLKGECNDQALGSTESSPPRVSGS